MQQKSFKPLLCLCTYLGFAVAADATVWKGSGTVSDPYIVSNAAELEAIETQYAASNHYYGVHFKQTADIDFSLNKSSFAGIAQGNDTTIHFDGIYDGGGYSIHNLKIDGVKYNASGKAQSSGSNSVAGLFGTIGKAGAVKNLTMAGDCSITAFRIVGSIAGKNDGRIEDCRNYATITAISNAAGGIAGQVTDTAAIIIRCYNAGYIKAGFNTVGGITSATNGKVTYCQNDGDVAATYVNSYKSAGLQYSAGGILGTEGQYSYVAYNVNTGNVSGTYVVGGITSGTPTYGATIVGNINYGAVSYQSPGSNSIGAIIGNEPNRDVVMANNYFDRQIGYYDGVGTASHTGVTGLTTAEMTSGKALDGLDSTMYDWQPGMYPVLKQFKSETQSIVNRAIVIALSNADENIQYFKSSATLSGATWKLAKGSKFSIDNGTLSVSGITDLTETDTLIATSGSYSKIMPLRSVNLKGAFDGEGTAASPFLIKAAADMQKLATLTNTNNIDLKGYYLQVANDIDFGSTTYEPVAVEGITFQGDFDGNGKKFTNVNFEISGTNGYRGLFGNVGQHGRVHNLNLQSGTLASYRGTAGIAGTVYGLIENCENHATITNTKSMGFGGIAGRVWSGGIVRNCRNYADLSVPRTFLGGIAYYVNPDGLIENCVNYGNLSSTAGSVGGITGENDGILRGCVNYGTISGASSLGGISYTNDGDAIIERCVNYGTIATDSTKISTGVGGILAISIKKEGTTKHVTNCSNYGSITAKGQIGGIVGKAQPGIDVSECANYGNIRTYENSTSEMVGGIMGNLETSEGYSNIVARCFNGGNVNATVACAGGIVGSLKSQITDCYNMGNISGKSDVGGIAGLTTATASIKGVYSAASVNGGNIIGGGSASVSNAYYDNSLSTRSETDPTATKGVDTKTLATTQVSNAFVLNSGMYPTLQALADSTAANWWAATVMPADGETLQNVASPLTIGTPAGTVWTSSANITVNGNIATPTATGEGWLTKTLGNMTRTYKLNIAGGTGIASAKTEEKTVMSELYYDLQGNRLSQPQSGIVVKVTNYHDGTSSTEKLCY